MKFISFFSLIFINSTLYAWDTTFKADLQRSSTDNANLTSSSPIADTYYTLGGTVQTKNDEFKLKAKFKKDQYTKEKTNDSTTTDISLQYKYNKAYEYTLSVSKQVYNYVPITTNDTTSDNTGAKFGFNYNKSFDKDSSGYFDGSFASKKYPNIINRTDKIVNLLCGFEHYFSESTMAVPEINLQKNTSTNNYYSNFVFGPSLLFSYTKNDRWEFFGDANYARTTYSGRTVSTIIRGRTSTQKEYQNLVGFNIGAIYSFKKYVTLQGKLATENNSSNNASSGYKSNILSLNLGFKI